MAVGEGREALHTSDRFALFGSATVRLQQSPSLAAFAGPMSAHPATNIGKWDSG